MASGGVPPDPGGYLETGGILPSAPHWKSYHGKDLYGDAALDKYDQYSDGTDAEYLGSLRKKSGGKR